MGQLQLFFISISAITNFSIGQIHQQFIVSYRIFDKLSTRRKYRMRPRDLITTNVKGPMPSLLSPVFLPKIDASRLFDKTLVKISPLKQTADTEKQQK